MIASRVTRRRTVRSLPIIINSRGVVRVVWCGRVMGVGYQCLVCGARFASQADLIDHLSAWRRSDSCPKRLISLMVLDEVSAVPRRGSFLPPQKSNRGAGAAVSLSRGVS